MDPMSFSAFNSLPYWDSSSMFINRSETSAARKLLQCKGFGVYENDVSFKFDKDPEDVPDMTKDDFVARKKVVDEVARWVEANDRAKGGKELIYKNEWVPILYSYELVQASAKRNQDWGHLIFTDLTITRFLLVMCFGPDSCNCGNPFHDDYGALVKLQADRFLSLVKYLFHDKDDPKPNWVRATYTTNSRILHPSFLSTHDSIVPSSVNPPIYHVTSETFVPSLTDGELERIDNLLSQGKSWEVPPPAMKKLVRGKKSERPDTNAAWLAGKEKSLALCAFCGKVGTQQMPTCSSCKLVRYCDKKCQTQAWSTHKEFCKSARKKSQATSATA